SAAVEPVDDVVRDPVALLLTEQQVAGQVGPLRVLGEEVAQQQGGLLHVAAGLLEQVEDPGVSRSEQRHPSASLTTPGLGPRGLHRSFTGGSPDGHGATPPARQPSRPMEAAQTDDVLYAGELEVRPNDGLVLAAGRALTLSVRE